MADDTELSAEDLKALDEMRAETPAPAEQVVETAQDATPEPVDDRPRDADGRFVAKEKAEEAKVETKAEEKPADKEAKVVPLASLLEERKEWQRKFEESGKTQAVLADRLRQIQEQIKPKEPAKPSIEEDPVAVLRETQQQVAQITQSRQQDVAQQQFAAHVGTQIEQFKATAPDYSDAYRFAREAYAQELRAVYGMSDEQIPTAIAQAEFNLAATALQRGKNPGEAVYEFAKARGYRKAEATQATPAAQSQSALERLATVAAGQAASKSLAGGGAAPATKLSLESLAEMTPEQLAKLPDDEFRRVMGG